jgi:hypothetical protein
VTSVARSLNRQYSSSRGTSPFNLVFGRMPVLAIGSQLGVFDSDLPVPKDGAVAAYNVDLANHVDELAAEAARRRAAAQQRNVAYQAKIGEARSARRHVVMQARLAQERQAAEYRSAVLPPNAVPTVRFKKASAGHLPLEEIAQSIVRTRRAPSQNLFNAMHIHRNSRLATISITNETTNAMLTCFISQ